MRGYRRRLLRALRVSLLVFGGLSLLVFFFDDGHKRPPVFAASAEANESLLPSKPVDMTRRFAPHDVVLPDAFRPQWRQVMLDGMSLYRLEKPFHLRQTRHQLGAEYYDYAAFLFEQMGAGVQDADLAGRLKKLSMQAQTLGHAVHQAGDLAYDGPALEGMEHVQVRAEIGQALDLLNTQAVQTSRLDQHGKLLEAPVVKEAQPGEALLAFHENTRAIFNHPKAGDYPQTMRLLKAQAHLLEALSTHLSLQWETTVSCGHTCDKALQVRIYTRQALSEKEIAATIQ